MTDTEKIQQEMRQLEEQIRYHNDRYYNRDYPEIDDYDYDQLTQRLRALEEEYPALKSQDSPTQMVGGESSSQFEKVTLAV